MNFIQSIVNDTIVTDEEVDKFLEELSTFEDIDSLDESAWERISARVEVRDMALYRLIVGSENLMKAKNFVEFSKQGKTIPATFVQGFQPALELLDDIVTAGPGYVQMLKVLHKRAKNASK